MEMRVLVCDVVSDLLPENYFDIALAYNVVLLE